MKLSVGGITEISALRYSVGGHYKFHTDYHFKIPRTLSLIYMVNEDYVGGSLCFKGPKTDDTEVLKKVEPKKNRLIIWPSCHLFPHAVEPVKEGVRYTIVCWAV
jgi:predicted 2-oxoglutarate/Fe(II)-dependent dioxygenase YbiX